MSQRIRVLLVEDDLNLQEILGAVLDDAGFDVVAMEDGTQAIAELNANAGNYEEVITDIDLGSGPNGWEVGRRAREYVADMQVIYMSGSRAAEWPSNGVKGSAFLAKPFRSAQMVNACRRRRSLEIDNETPSLTALDRAKMYEMWGRDALL